MLEARYQLKDKSRHYPVGVDLKNRPDLATERAASEQAIDAHNAAGIRWLEECVRPTERAAITLLLTPAPDMAAVHFKLEVIEKHELYGLGSHSARLRRGSAGRHAPHRRAQLMATLPKVQQPELRAYLSFGFQRGASCFRWSTTALGRSFAPGRL